MKNNIAQNIIIKGARENNLKNISVEIPKKKITVITGISGSGKSSLVFDTIAAESQRLLNETYNSFIRHRLQQYGKPDIDDIQNLSVAMIINQKRIEGNSRSTVGTVTDIYSLFRVLFSRLGKPFIGHSNAFSFNNIQGMCTKCEGLGKVNTIDFDKLINKEKSLNEGAINFPTFEVRGWRWSRYAYSGLFDNDKKLKNYNSEEWNNLIYAKTKLKKPDSRYPKSGDYEGLSVRFERSFFKKDSREIKGKNSEIFKQIVTQKICPECNGSRLNRNVLNCKINGKNIADCCKMQIDNLIDFIENINDKNLETVISSIKERLYNLNLIGLNYLTLDRETSTLSGGESQRIKLIRHLGSSLTDLIYIFDEPSVGLHPNDIHRLNKLLIQLRDKGNTILIVEHDLDVIQIADNIIDMGIGAGKNGGNIVFHGNLNDLKNSKTLTGNYLLEKKTIKEKYRISKNYFSLKNINHNNLRNISIKIPKQILTTLTGVAGSGKSSLVNCLVKKYTDFIILDQKSIHASKRSNIATYTGIMDFIRNKFAEFNKVKSSLFSNNSEGACKECRGLGIISTDLAFMDNIETICEECEGSGYNNDILKYNLNEKNIVDILNLSISEAKDFFMNSNIEKILKNLCNVGLEYLTIGQTLNTLSGGEKQRLKLVIELDKKGNNYIFDEPTTGLHGSDISKLMKLFNKLVDDGNTVIIIEHNLDVISQADWIIDIGPNAGTLGGKIIFEGFPKDIIKSDISLTGKFLRKYIGK